jgi:hypothetical protein
MGDYKKHSAETGRGLCNSFEDVISAGVSSFIVLSSIYIERQS